MAAAAGERGEGAEAAEPGAGLAVTALHFECIATRRLDFRELSLLAQLCKAARQAVAQGPLHIMTDVTRVLSHADLDHVLHLLRWCGGVVHVLRLHQQSRALWAPPGIMDDDERRMSRMAAMERMPFPQTSILEKVRQRCPNLQELLIDGWMAYCGTDPHYQQVHRAPLVRYSQFCVVPHGIVPHAAVQASRGQSREGSSCPSP